MKALDRSEQGLHAFQYAMKLCEDLGLPGVKTNLESVGMAIEAISKSHIFRGRERAVEEAFLWLHRRVMVAEQQGAKITHFWFRDAEYKNVDKPIEQKFGYDCDSLCKAHHGKGYHLNDVKWVMVNYFREVAGGGSRTPEYFFRELDGKRAAGPPEWKR